jgi:hypothetical protein
LGSLRNVILKSDNIKRPGHFALTLEKGEIYLYLCVFVCDLNSAPPGLNEKLSNKIIIVVVVVIVQGAGCVCI